MRLTKRIKNDIEQHATGSIYRNNASSADWYVFNLCYNSKGRLDFEGGWDWSYWTESALKKISTYAFDLNKREFIKL